MKIGIANAPRSGRVRLTVAVALTAGVVVAVTATPRSASADHGPSGWMISTAASALPDFVDAVAADSSGNIYMVVLGPGGGATIRKQDVSGVGTTLAGGSEGFSGDGGPATSARLNSPRDLSLDNVGGLLVVDSGNRRVRRIAPGADGVLNGGADEIITTVVGGGTPADGVGDGGPASAAQLPLPSGIDVDRLGDLFIADGYYRVRKVIPGADGVVDGDTDETVTTVAGNGTFGFSGDGRLATAAQLNNATDVSADTLGNLYIADQKNNRIRKVDQAGIITTIAGDGTRSYGGDGGAAVAAQLNRPSHVEVQGSGNVFVADNENHAIRRIDAAGIIDTVAGNGFIGSDGDGGFGPDARAGFPKSPTFDQSGHLYFASTGSVRRVEASLLWIRAPKLPKVGDVVTFTMAISSPPVAASGLTLTTTLPPELAFAGASPNQGTCAQSSGTLNCQLGSVQPGGIASVMVTASVQATGYIGLTASFGAADSTTVPGLHTVTSYTRISDRDCGRVVNTDTLLVTDVGPCAGDGLVIGRNRVSLDLGGHTVFGFPGPGNGNSAGIRLPTRTAVTVSNGTVRDFDAGVVVNGGRSNTIRNLQLLDNVGPDDPDKASLGDGIFVAESVGLQVLDNVLIGNGRYDGIGILGSSSDDSVVRGNLVENTLGMTSFSLLDVSGAAGQGIIFNGANAGSAGIQSERTITGSLVTGNTVRGSASGGIANVNHAKAEISANTVEGNGFTGLGDGNGIGVQIGPRLRTNVTSLRIQNNQVHGNAESGIKIAASTGNTILNNNASNNRLKPPSSGQPAFDLFDQNPNCGTNSWSGNTWGSGGYWPACTSTGGSAATTMASSMAASDLAVSSMDRLPPPRRFPPADSN